MRLINQEEQEFVYHTITLMAVGFVVILIFLVVLFKVLNVQ